MRKRKIYLYSTLCLLVISVYILLNDSNNKDYDSDLVITALRDAGHQLLLSNNDSTSLVLPVTHLSTSLFEIKFEQDLRILPNDVVKYIKNAFSAAEIPNDYQVTVTKCFDEEVVYSYKISSDKERTIIPCSGRYLPRNCYAIEVNLINKPFILNRVYLLYFLGFIVILFLIDLLIKGKIETLKTNDNNKNQIAIGKLTFHPAQHKLSKEAVEIPLSKKECELLIIFVSNPNKIVTREELTKKVWEDNGVIVGRSLDTYISKLRKKLKEDSTIKLVNIHGVGYKLEIN